MLRFTANTIGCKVNQYETRAAAGLLSALGAVEVGSTGRSGGDGEVDLVLVNTCCVTAAAAAKSRRAVRRSVRRHPRADVLIFGCYATRQAQLLRQLARRAGSSGNVHLAGHCDDVAECLLRAAASLRQRRASGDGPSSCARAPTTPGTNQSSKDFRRPSLSGHGQNANLTSLTGGPVRYDESMKAGPHQHPASPTHISASRYDSIQPRQGSDVKNNIGTALLPPIANFAGRQRAFVKVQDGCDAGCSYCLIPRLRRRVWSRPMEQILTEVRALAANGHKEVVLCGVFLGAYGRATAVRRKWPGPSALPELLARVAAVEGLWRVRLSSLEPGDVSDKLLEVMAESPNVAPHLHLSLQSGSGPVLRRMNRQYGPEEFLAAVGRARRRLDRPAVTTDVIVGFPGEGEDDFAATLSVARRAGFAKIHIFSFSARPDTAAWKWRREAPPPPVVKARCKQLAELERQSAQAFRRQFVGRRVEVLVEQPNSKTPPGHARGLTDRYVEVTFPLAEPALPAELPGQVVPVRIAGLGEHGLVGSRVESEGVLRAAEGSKA